MSKPDAPTPTPRSQRTPEDLFRTGGAASWVEQADEAFWQQQIGERLGPYELVELIGEGGMSVVFRGRRADGAFEREVAIKFIRQSRDAERLLDEAKAVAALKHPGIVDLIDAGRWNNDIPYLVLELVDGVTLDRYVKEQRPGFGQRLDLWLAIGDAVAFAHSHFLAHRDIKPANILIETSGRPRLVDFGIASGMQLADAGSDPRAGTPYYMAPEQWSDSASSDHGAADQYALGLLLAELLLDRRIRHYRADGTTLDSASSLALTWSSLDGQQRTALSQSLGLSRGRLGRRLAGDLSAVIAKATEDDPGQRYRSVAELSAEVRRWRDGYCVEARPAGPAKRLRKLVWRRRRLVGVTAILALLLAVQTTATILRLNEERDRALQAEANARASSRFLVDLLASVDPMQGKMEQFTPKQLFLRAMERAEDLPEASSARGEILLALGELGIGLSELERADSLLQRARAAFEESQALDGAIEARLSREYARLNYYRGKNEEAFDHAKRAWTQMRGLRGEQDRETFEIALDMATLNPDRLAGAHALTAALESPFLDPGLSQEARNWRLTVLINLSFAHDAAGQHDQALLAADQALQLADESTQFHLMPAILSSRAYIQFHRGELADARRNEQQALDLKRELFSPAHLGIFSSLDTLARIEAAAQDMPALLALAQQALAELDRGKIDQWIYTGKQRVWGGRAALAELRLGHPELAVARLQQIESSFGHNEPDAFDAVCAHVYQQAGRSDLAQPCLQRWRATPQRAEWVREEVVDFALELSTDTDASD
ncbi:serine/threonine-protein kinase [Pseudomarimonas arenosa]|uniref:Protein kinase n=1 Tax=Pseudomarimonas arenosa TaxID=2774145 RepID=A0AAW3ZNE0_9GAMM|nr:serine/threonine-protein kinase [Pseudomarimonas arenosa]MBD8525881.1 protein kinase [Pseudomarimonas arenosa]